MTQLNVTFCYGAPPTERNMQALNVMRSVYGVRQIKLDERFRTVSVEYDASRLAEGDVSSLIRNAGIAILGKVDLIARRVPPPCA